MTPPPNRRLSRSRLGRMGLAMAGLAALLAVGADVPAIAVTQGSAGSTSTGSITITITIPSLTRISALNDIALGTWSGSGPLSGRDNAICVWSSTGGYSVTATGSGAGGAFQLASGANRVDYTVQWAQTGGATSGAAMTQGAALTGRTTSATATDCSTGAASTAGVFVSISVAELSSTPAGTYNGTLQLLITPT